MSDSTLDRAFGLIALEREIQRERWGEDTGKHPILMATILAEECGEVARAALERNDEQLRDEAIQVAAVALSIIEQRLPAVPVEEERHGN